MVNLFRIGWPPWIRTRTSRVKVCDASLRKGQRTLRLSSQSERFGRGAGKLAAKTREGTRKGKEEEPILPMCFKLQVLSRARKDLHSRMDHGLNCFVNTVWFGKTRRWVRAWLPVFSSRAFAAISTYPAPPPSWRRSPRRGPGWSGCGRPPWPGGRRWWCLRGWSRRP